MKAQVSRGLAILMIFLVGVNSGGLLVIGSAVVLLSLLGQYCSGVFKIEISGFHWVCQVTARGWRRKVNINKRGCHGRCCTARTCSLRGCLEDASTPEIRKGQIPIILYLCSYRNWNMAEKKS